MNAILLAGTFDWGVCPLTLAAPRALVPVANRPLISYSLRALKDAGATDVVICSNGGTAEFKRVLGDGSRFGVRCHYLQDSMPRGPAGCAKDAAAMLGDDDCIVLEGALLPDMRLDEFFAAHRRSGATLTIGVDNSVPPARWREGFSPRMRGVYAFTSKALSYVPQKGFQDIKEGLVARLYEAGHRVEARCVKGFAPRVTGPESYLAINGWVLELVAGDQITLTGYRKRGELLVHPTAEVDSTARIAGPVVIGSQSVVRARTVIIGPTSIGEGCNIDSGAVVCFSAVWNHVQIGSGAHVRESILANGASVLPGSEVFSSVLLATTRKNGQTAGNGFGCDEELFEQPGEVGRANDRGLLVQGPNGGGKTGRVRRTSSSLIPQA